MPDRISFAALNFAPVRVFKTLSNIRLKSCQRRQRRRRLTVRTTSKSSAAALVVRFDGQGPPMPFMSRHQLTGAKTSLPLSPLFPSPFLHETVTHAHTRCCRTKASSLCVFVCWERGKTTLTLNVHSHFWVARLGLLAEVAERGVGEQVLKLISLVERLQILCRQVRRCQQKVQGFLFLLGTQCHQISAVCVS